MRATVWNRNDTYDAQTASGIHMAERVAGETDSFSDTALSR